MANTKDLLKKSSGVKGWWCMPLVPAGRSLRSKPTCSTEQVPGQAMLHGETLSGGKSGGKESYRNRLHKCFLEYRHTHVLKRVKQSFLITK